MEPSFAERIERIRALCATLDDVSANLFELTVRAEALSHEAALLATEAADAVARERRQQMRLTEPRDRSDDTDGSS